MKSRVSAWLSAAVLAVATVACSQSDAGITTAVKSKLAADDTVKAYQINVDTKRQIVTLNGKVDDARARTRAIELAKATKGVLDVVDNLTVASAAAPRGADDAALNRARDAAASTTDTVGTAGSAVGDAALTAKVK